MAIIGDMTLRLKVRDDKLKVASPDEEALVCFIEFNDDGRLYVNGEMVITTRPEEPEEGKT